MKSTWLPLCDLENALPQPRALHADRHHHLLHSAHGLSSLDRGHRDEDELTRAPSLYSSPGPTASTNAFSICVNITKSNTAAATPAIPSASGVSSTKPHISAAPELGCKSLRLRRGTASTAEIVDRPTVPGCRLFSFGIISTRQRRLEKHPTAIRHIVYRATRIDDGRTTIRGT